MCLCPVPAQVILSIYRFVFSSEYIKITAADGDCCFRKDVDGIIFSLLRVHPSINIKIIRKRKSGWERWKERWLRMKRYILIFFLSVHNNTKQINNEDEPLILEWNNAEAIVYTGEPYPFCFYLIFSPRSWIVDGGAPD